jgi:glycerol-3-phosphate acyltransferase PlsY
MTFIILIIASYLLGSIPFGLLLNKLAGKGDIRKVSSGSIGATNVSRTLGIFGFIATWLLDMAKVIAPFMIFRVMLGDAGTPAAAAGALAGAIAVLGHIFPVWLKFKGGKGISGIFGFILALNPIAFVAEGLIWLLVAMSSGYSSLGALVVLLLLPVFGFAAAGFWTGIIALFLAALGFWAHRENIVRLLAGTESKMQLKLGKLTAAFVIAGIVVLGLAIALR